LISRKDFLKTIGWRILGSGAIGCPALASFPTQKETVGKAALYRGLKITGVDIDPAFLKTLKKV
jgi:hypothetical protein